MRNRTDKDMGGDKAVAQPRMAYTMKETAGLLGISYLSVHRLVQRNKLRASKALPGRVLIAAREIENFLNRAS